MLPCRNLYAVPDTVLLHMWFHLRWVRHSSAAQLVSLEIMDGTYESIYLVAFILAGPVHHNALTNCAAQLSSRGPSLALWAIHLVPHSALINPHV